MNIFLYSLLFITGTFFGSFFTLAVYRIPRNEDILIKHSYCPNCQHKLGLFDLFPVLSYVFLKGKCRYCKNKIRPRYLLIELLSGLSFVLIAFSVRLNIFDQNSIITTIANLLYISILFMIAAIDLENIKIEKKVIFVGYVLELFYIIYQCTLQHGNVYPYVIYLFFLIVILIFSNISLKRFMLDKYYVQILYLCLYMMIFTGSKIFILTAILFYILLIIINYFEKKKKNNQPIAIGFFLCISNISVIIITNLLMHYII